METEHEVPGREEAARDRQGSRVTRIEPVSFRFDPPIPHSERVQRQRLTQLLTASRERLVLIVAPAGYGKTTLAAQWRELDDRIFAWVMLGPGTSDTLELWSYIVQSVGRALPDFASTAERLGFWLMTAEPDTIAPNVAEALAGVGRELVIVLDDYHDVRGADAHSTIGSFVDRAPPSVQLAVVSRRDPPLAVGRLRASGELLELRAADLAFRDEEIDQLANGGLSLDLSPAAIAMLRTRTEGWPAGVALACMSLRDQDDREGFIERFGGSNRFVVDYLTEVVLERLDPARRSFLLETSILERMSGELCDAVLERGGSAHLLAEIQREDLFLAPLDERADWYRYHPVFREFLFRELTLQGPARVPALRRRAFDWLTREHMLDDAFRQALALRAYDEAARLVCENWLPLSVPRTIGMLLGWIDEFPKDVLRANAALCIARGCVLRLLGDYQGALHAIADARAAEWKGPLPDGQSSVEAAAEMLRASMMLDDVSEQLRAARRGFELASDGAPTFQVLTRAFLGRALHWTEIRFRRGSSRNRRPRTLRSSRSGRSSSILGRRSR